MATGLELIRCYTGAAITTSQPSSSAFRAGRRSAAGLRAGLAGDSAGLGLAVTGLAVLGGGRPGGGSWPVRGDRAAVGQELAGVVEDDDAVAQQAPSLPGVAGDG